MGESHITSEIVQIAPDWKKPISYARGRPNLHVWSVGWNIGCNALKSMLQSCISRI